jgi:hypothetical protein
MSLETIAPLSNDPGVKATRGGSQAADSAQDTRSYTTAWGYVMPS